MKHYIDIERFKTKNHDMFIAGEHIVIEEKVDGANASFTYDQEKDEVIAFSRKQELSFSNTLRGYWDWVQTLDKNIIKEITLNGRFIIFGEWLVSHTVEYDKERYNKFYMFDVWDRENNCYLSFIQTCNVYSRISERINDNNFQFVPVLYVGDFTNWEDIKQYVGTTKIQASPCGEGIVIKSIENSNKPKYTKIVSEQFSEVHEKKSQKEVSPEALKKYEEDLEIVSSIVTERRVQKIVEKLVDEGTIPSDWDEHNLKELSKICPKLVFEDCRKEEPEIMQMVENFGKLCAKVTMVQLRKLII